MSRMPVIYLPHGGGPWPFVELGMNPKELDDLAAYLRSISAMTSEKPKAILAVSAHWEERAFTVMTHAKPPMLYDYYGFPPAAYQVQWNAPGSPALAARVKGLLDKAGFPTAVDDKRGFDHGTFVPLKLTYPEADIPTIQLSLRLGLDPEEHINVGRALAPLRDEGVLIVGSGMSFHNMRAFGSPSARPVADAFDAWLQKSSLLEAKARDRALIGWEKAPGARQCHPHEEHLLPLMVVAGAAGNDRGHVPFSGPVLGMRVSAVHFG